MACMKKIELKVSLNRDIFRYKEQTVLVVCRLYVKKWC